jgi:hypothetical protein
MRPVVSRTNVMEGPRLLWMPVESTLTVLPTRSVSLMRPLAVSRTYAVPSFAVSLKRVGLKMPEPAP